MAVITEKIGDIFSAPAHSILIHACNAKGEWGAGVALAFKQKYPQAFKTYTTHCKHLLPPSSKTSLPTHQRSLAGTTLLIPPSPTTTAQHWIACLITSVSYGRGRDSEAQILDNTRRAMADLERQIQALKDDDDDAEGMGEYYAVPINSGKFGVPWGRTKAVLEEGGVDVTVVGIDEETFRID